MEQAAAILKALADKTRLRILLLLSRREMAVCELLSELDLSQPAVSHHLKLLKYAGLVKDVREGKWIYYTVDRENYTNHIQELNRLLNNVAENVARGTMPSPIRNQPCLCEELKTKKVKETI